VAEQTSLLPPVLRALSGSIWGARDGSFISILPLSFSVLPNMMCISKLTD
jgi:hypothetical protein